VIPVERERPVNVNANVNDPANANASVNGSPLVHARLGEDEETRGRSGLHRPGPRTIRLRSGTTTRTRTT
jgi:hypothetical protein